MLGFARSTITRFGNRDDGAIAVTFAVSATAMILACGLAIDVGRAYSYASSVSSALDAAALAGAKALRLQNMTKAQAEAVAKRVFEANLVGGIGGARVDKLSIVADPKTSALDIAASGHVDLTLAKVSGIGTMPFRRAASAVFEMKNVEIAVQLDLTGSMGGQKIADLRSATALLVDTVIPDGDRSGIARIALAPYSSGVNAGSFAAAVTGGRSSAAGSTCVFERRHDADQDSDVAPEGTRALRSRADLPSGASYSSCPSARVVPLTDDKALLKGSIATYTAGGNTAGHLGTAWAAYLLSPSWSAIWPAKSVPAGYSDTDTVKYAVLMTDGEYNTYNGKSSASKSLDAALGTCKRMRAAGITIFTIGFKLTASGAKKVMAACASDSSKAYLADDGDALKAAFKSIGETIVTLRLSS